MPWPLIIALALGASSEPPEKTQVRPGRYDAPPTSVLGRERLDEVSGADLAAALDSEPGLTITRLGGLGAFTTLSLRGSTPEQVLVALDGIPLNPADGAPVDLSSLPLGPLGAVEIYRGRTPWSLGVSGLGGALVLRSRPPTGADGELVWGSFQTAALRAFAGVPIDLGQARADVSFAVDALHSAGDFTFSHDGGTAWTRDDDHLATRRNAGVDQLTSFLRGGLTLGDWRLTVLDVFSASERGLPSLGVTPTRESRFTLRRNLVALHLAGAPAPLVVSANAWLADSTTEVHDPLGEIGLGRGRSQVTSTVPGATLTMRLPHLLSPELRLIPSLHLAWRSETSHGTALPRSNRDVLALAAELGLEHAAGVTLAAGLRAESDFAETSFAAFLESALALDDLRLTFGARLAPRLPSLFERYGDTGLALGNPELRPEHATTLELGARWDPPIAGARPLALAVFAYATWADDLIQFIQNSQGVSRPENLSAARILGLELSLEATLDRLYLRSALTLMDAVDASDIAARRDNHLPLRPVLSTSHRLELRLHDDALGPRRGATGLYLELDHVAGNHLDFANLVAIPPRTLLGAGAYVRADHAEVQLSLANLLADRVQDLAGYPLPGLTVMLSLRLETRR